MILDPPSAAASSEALLACLDTVPAGSVVLPTGSVVFPAGSEALPAGSEVLLAGSQLTEVFLAGSKVENENNKAHKANDASS